MKSIHVYVSTTSHEDQEVVELYEEIEKLLKEDETYLIILMGGFNAGMQKKEDDKETAIANFGIDEKNGIGKMLLDFALEKNL